MWHNFYGSRVLQVVCSVLALLACLSISATGAYHVYTNEQRPNAIETRGRSIVSFLKSFHTTHDNGVFIFARFGGIPSPALFDTGSEATLIGENLLLSIEKRSGDLDMLGKGKIYGVTGNSTEASKYRITVSVGGCKTTLVVWVVSDRSYPIIGYDFVRAFDTVLLNVEQSIVSISGRACHDG